MKVYNLFARIRRYMNIYKGIRRYMKVYKIYQRHPSLTLALPLSLSLFHFLPPSFLSSSAASRQSSSPALIYGLRSCRRAFERVNIIFCTLALQPVAPPSGPAHSPLQPLLLQLSSFNTRVLGVFCFFSLCFLCFGCASISAKIGKHRILEQPLAKERSGHIVENDSSAATVYVVYFHFASLPGSVVAFRSTDYTFAYRLRGAVFF